MLIVGTNGQRNVRIGENWLVAIGGLVLQQYIGCTGRCHIERVYWRVTSCFE